MMIFESIKELSTIFLLAIGLFSLITGLIQNKGNYGWVEGFSILATSFILMAVYVTSEYKQQKKIEELDQQKSVEKITVMRGEEEMQISISDIVVGDLIQIEAGMKVPVDCILVSGSEIKCDEKIFTGKSDFNIKSPLTEQNILETPKPFLWAKTQVKSGSGLAIVCTVGRNINLINVKETVLEEDEEQATPLQEKLMQTMELLGKVAGYFAIFVFILLITKFIIVTVAVEHRGLFTVATIKELQQQLCFAITLYILITPVGVPMAINMSIAKSIPEMLKGGVLIRRLAVQELLGEISEIVADKQTLTQNTMAVKEIFFNDKVYSGRVSNLKSQANSDKFAEAVFYSTTSRVEIDSHGKQIFTEGTPIEQGIIKYLMEAGFDAQSETSQRDLYILQKIAKRKTMVAIRHPSNDNLVRVYVKGTSENVLSTCKYFFDQNGNKQELDQTQRDRVLGEISERFEKNQFRSIMFASTDMAVEEYESLKSANNNFQTDLDKQVLESNLALVGIYALRAPLKEETVEAIRKCHQAGINVRMVTADNLTSAKITAIEAGIITKEEAEQEYVCMEGNKFREICGGLVNLTGADSDSMLNLEVGNKEMFRIVKNKLKVLGRAAIQDKFMLVAGLKEYQGIVAVTADGTNDAPSLKKADIGFAMGIEGTEIAQMSSDAILLDDNFVTILNGVKQGRNIFENVKKFFQFQLTVNLVIMLLVAVCGISNNDEPLTALQLLWMNLIVDIGATFALANEHATDDILN
eukprot:403357675